MKVIAQRTAAEMKVIFMDSLEILEDRLRKLEEKIRQVKRQLPAHSIKPPVMITLIDLEDKRDTILEQINSMKKKT